MAELIRFLIYIHILPISNHQSSIIEKTNPSQLDKLRAFWIIWYGVPYLLQVMPMVSYLTFGFFITNSVWYGRKVFRITVPSYFSYIKWRHILWGFEIIHQQMKCYPSILSGTLECVYIRSCPSLYCWYSSYHPEQCPNSKRKPAHSESDLTPLKSIKEFETFVFSIYFNSIHPFTTQVKS